MAISQKKTKIKATIAILLISKVTIKKKLASKNLILQL